jgi:hypothetical protein
MQVILHKIAESDTIKAYTVLYEGKIIGRVWGSSNNWKCKDILSVITEYLPSRKIAIEIVALIAERTLGLK